MNKTVVSILSSKGGVGKSYIATLVANSILSLNANIKFYDNDSETPRLSQYTSLESEHIQLYNLDNDGYVKAESLNINAMDTITNELESGDSNIILVDNGSPSFQPYLSYFQYNTIELFNNIDVDFIIVIPISKDTVTHNAPIEVLNSYGNRVKYILIENEHFGAFEYDVSAFDKLNVQYSIIKMERYTNAQMKDINMVQELNLLLDEAVKNKDFNLVSKSRLSMAKASFENVFLKILDNFGVSHEC
jgi:hypothetical protein